MMQLLRRQGDLMPTAGTAGGIGGVPGQLMSIPTDALPQPNPGSDQNPKLDAVQDPVQNTVQTQVAARQAEQDATRPAATSNDPAAALPHSGPSNGSHQPSGNGMAGTNGVGTNRVTSSNGAGVEQGAHDHNPPSSQDGASSPNIPYEDGAAADAALSEALAQGRNVPLSAVKIKGRPGGVSLEIGDGDWVQILKLLEERLVSAEGFFRGGRVVLEVGERPLVEMQLREVRNLLEAHAMKLGVVRSTADRTLQAALELGVSTSNQTEEVEALEALPPLPDMQAPVDAVQPQQQQPPRSAVHFVHRGSLRSGQVLRKNESVVVIGDVNPGAQVISGGDVMVWGRLRGVVHAGCDGNRRAVVTALDFVPTQLRIANMTTISPEQKRSLNIFFWRKEPNRRPEIARIVDGKIVVEPWDEAKPGFLSLTRK